MEKKKTRIRQIHLETSFQPCLTFSAVVPASCSAPQGCLFYLSSNSVRTCARSTMHHLLSRIKILYLLFVHTAVHRSAYVSVSIFFHTSTLSSSQFDVVIGRCITIELHRLTLTSSPSSACIIDEFSAASTPTCKSFVAKTRVVVYSLNVKVLNLMSQTSFHAFA